VDEKEEDRSEESFGKHLEFYKKLEQKITDIKNEIEHSSDAKILKHLKERIDAIELDKKRIKNMFKEKNDDVWNNL
jgi:predicted nuclease with TOPRIM domain